MWRAIVALHQLMRLPCGVGSANTDNLSIQR